MAKEKRLISADAMKEVLERYLNAPHIQMQYSSHAQVMRSAIQTCIELIDIPKTVDAVEVVHGRWIVEVDGNFRNVQCSKCGKDYACHIGMLQLQNLSYCPNCGAKMDGDGNEID